MKITCHQLSCRLSTAVGWTLILVLFTTVMPFGTLASAKPLFLERYGAEQLDLEYYWISGLTDHPGSICYPFSHPYVMAVLDDLDNHAGLKGYSGYLYGRHMLFYDSDRPGDDGTRTRRFTNWLLQDLLGIGGFTRDLYRFNNDLYQQRDGKLVFGANQIQRFESIYDETFRNDSFIIYTWGIETWLTYRQRFGAYLRFTDTVERGAGGHYEVYAPYAGYYTATKDHTSISYDETITYLGYRGEYFSTRIGRGKHHWGPGTWHQLSFGSTHAPYPYLEGSFHWRNRIRLTAFHADLNPEPVVRDTLYTTPEGNVRLATDRKWLAAHRLEVIPASWLTLGFSEAVFYGERDPQFEYMLPLNIYWSENHHQDMDDNVMWAADLRIRPMKGLALHGELLIDEMNLGAFGSEEFGNRTGYLAGGRWIGPLGFMRHQLRVEYVRLRPFVYTHWFEINVATHFGENTGSRLQPNSDEWNFSWQFFPVNELMLELFAMGRRHGETPPGAEPVGGSVYETRAGNAGIYPFLAGQRQDRNEVGITVRWQALESLAIHLTGAAGKDSGEDSKRFLAGLYWHY